MKKLVSKLKKVYMNILEIKNRVTYINLELNRQVSQQIGQTYNRISKLEIWSVENKQTEAWRKKHAKTEKEFETDGAQ